MPVSFIFKHVRKLEKVLSMVCLLVLLSPLCRAGIVYVDNSDDSVGSGLVSLRDAITTSNSDNADTTISWRYTGGTISLGSSLPNINGVTTLDVTNTASAVTLYSSNDDYTLGLGGTVTIKNDNTSTPMTIAVILTSTGSLTKDGDGTLYLTKDNSYSGGTILQKGIISVAKNSALGNAAGTLTFDGGTLQIRDNISSARSVILKSGGGAIDTNTSYTLYLTGVISGAGGLTKLSDGMLVLSGPNTYSGGTIISDGTLQAGADNTLPFGGAVTVASGAQLGIGAYTQAIDSYSGPGTLALTLKSGVTNIAITNTATLTGGTLAVGLTPQVITAGQIFTPITAGLITGEFTSITAPAALSFAPTYSPGSVVLTAGLVPFATVAETRNQKAVGNNLEAFRVSPSGDVSTVIGNLYTLNSVQLNSAFDQIGPFSLASMRGIGMAGAAIQSAAVNQRLDALTDGSDRGGFASYNLTGRSSEPGEFHTDAKHSDADVSRLKGGERSREPWGFFASGVGTVGTVNKKTDEQPAYKFYSGGLIMGADYRFNEHLAAGLLGGYLDGQASVSSPGRATVDNRSARYGFYASGHGDTFHANLYAGKAADSFATERKVAFGDISRKATAKPGGDEINLGVSAGYDGWGPVSSFAGLNYDRLKIDAFTEKGAESLNLKVSAQTAESMKSSLGLRYADKVVFDSSLLASYISVAWRHEFKDKGDIEAQLASGTGGAFSVAAGDSARDSALGGIGISANWGGQTTISLDYSADVRSHFVEQVFSAGLRLKFSAYLSQ